MTARSILHCPRRGLRAALPLVLVAALASSTLADVVVLDDGRRIEGTVTSETKAKVVVDTRFGKMEFSRTDVVEIVRGKTRDQEFDERWKSAKTAGDFSALGKWAEGVKLRSKAKKCMKRVIAIEKNHAEARTWLGFVLYAGEWLTPEERDERVRADETAEMLAKGFVRHESGWVTVEEKAKLDQGLVLFEGQWMTPDESMRAQGFEQYAGAWLPRAEAFAYADADAVEHHAKTKMVRLLGANALIAGNFPRGKLEPIGAGIDEGRRWFDATFGAPAGLGLLGDRFAEFYLFARDSTPYVSSTDHLASLTPTVPPGWADVVKKTHGFVWWDPYCVSSARQWKRPEEDVVGHCYHHWGHLLLNRLGYDGRLLPPWYDEGFASFTEYRIHEKNAVFCNTRVSGVTISGGTSVKHIEFQFDAKGFRDGTWRDKLRAALEAGKVPHFDKLAQKEFTQLLLLDIATGMAIVEWLEGRDGALPRFHAVLRERAPGVPLRVIRKGAERQAAYDAAFGAAVDMGWREADKAWEDMVSDDSVKPKLEDLPKIPGYRLEGVLGRGATGVVYGATQLAVDRAVALKILRPELVGTKRAVRRLQREARIAARLAHPNLISAIDMGEVHGQWWYAMELVEGVSLAEKLAETGPMKERDALRLFIPLCDALQHAFENKVVHRDVKPANILIDDHGRARLVDLGLAFAEDDPMITRSGGTLGTPHYISPEQAREPSTVDIRTDIWSLGASLFQAVCGRPPFEGESVAEILSSVLYHRIPDPRRLAPDLSRGLALVLRKCMARDPDRRYQEPIELMRDLERIRERRSPVVRASALDPVAGSRPEWLNLTTGSLFAAVIAIGVWLTVVQPWRPPEVAGTTSATGWPALEKVWANFEVGHFTHERALRELAEHSEDLPGEFRLQHNKLQTDVRDDLDRALGDIVVAVQGEFDRLLADRGFDEIRTLLEQEMPKRVVAATGYRQVSILPGTAGRQFRDWRDELDARLASARQASRAAAQARFRRHYEGIRPDLERLGKAYRWREALELLKSVTLEEAGVDLRGLTEDEQRALVRTIDVERRVDEKDLRTSLAQVNGELRYWIRTTGEVLREKLESGDERDVADNLIKAFDAELIRLGLDRDQVPDGWPADAFANVQSAAEELRVSEAQLVEQYALASFEQDERDSETLCGRRAYGEAADLWRGPIDDELRASVLERMKLRLRECQLLQGLLARAASNVTQKSGEELEIYARSILYKGKVDPGSDPLERGFELITDRDRKRFFLKRPDDLQREGNVLRPEAVEALADLDATPEDDLLKALFRYHEGDFRGALKVLPIGSLTRDDLAHDLRERILSALEKKSEEVENRTVELTQHLRNIKWNADVSGYTLTRSLRKRIADVKANYGDLLDDKDIADLRAIEEALERGPEAPTIESAYGPDEAKLGSASRDVTMSWSLKGPTAGGWKPGEWEFLDDGLELRETVKDDEALLALETGPRLVLGAPLDANARLTVVLDFAPANEQRIENTLIVSVAGFHTAFVDDPDSPRVVVAATSADDVLRLAREGSGQRFDPFERGKPFRLEIEAYVDGNSIEVHLNGKQINTRSNVDRDPFVEEPDLIAVRSMHPLRLEQVTLDGKLRPR